MSVIAVSQILGIEIDQAIERLESKFTLPPGRMTLLPAQHEAWILDSSYNSSPDALRSVLQTVKNVKGFKRKVLILGDMRELGPLEAKAHRNFAESVSTIADYVVLVGPKMQQYLLPELQKRNVSVQHFPHSLGVGQALLDEKVIQSGDLVLVKGSQNTIFLEQTVQELMLHPEQARTLLCRQEAHWDHDRQAYWSSVS
jgi:UDP-N-acetylmuramoyl-tripeptide--D-alanyl-D-alanine ligase